MIAVIAIIRAALELLTRLNAGPEKMSPGDRELKFQDFLKLEHLIFIKSRSLFAVRKGAEIPLPLRFLAVLGRSKEVFLRRKN